MLGLAAAIYLSSKSKAGFQRAQKREKHKNDKKPKKDFFEVKANFHLNFFHFTRRFLISHRGDSNIKR